MSRYFNSIARQTGRGSGGTAGLSKPPAAISTKNTRVGDEPLDREEILMVPSEAAKGASSRYDGPAMKSSDLEPVRKKNGRKVDEKKISASEPPGRKTSRQDLQVESTKTSPKKSEPVAPDRTYDDPIKKETVFVRAGESNTGTKVQPGSADKEKRAKADKKEEKRFFEKTSEIIEGRRAEPDEVRNIVLREVQEWVAAVPVEATSDAERISADGRHTQPEEPKSADLTLRQKNSVVSIAEAPSKAETNGEMEDAPTEEHFELSIGTISVVIESDEKPRVQNEPPPRLEQLRTTSTERSVSSLLERSYL